jgi:ABC-2 type transport system permease protein
MIAALRIASNDASAKGNRLLAKYYGDHPELVAESDVQNAMNDVAVTQLAVNEEIERQVRPVVDRYDVQLSRQQALVDRFRLLSPAIVAQDALNDVAGTGSARYRHFVSLVEDYHQGWQTLFAAMIVGKQRVTPAVYDALPQFQYREESFDVLASRIGAALVFLVAAGITLAAIGVSRLRSYPVAG